MPEFATGPRMLGYTSLTDIARNLANAGSEPDPECPNHEPELLSKVRISEPCNPHAKVLSRPQIPSGTVSDLWPAFLPSDPDYGGDRRVLRRGISPGSTHRSGASNQVLGISRLGAQ